MIKAAKELGAAWEGMEASEAPAAPESLEETGLSLGFLNDMIMLP